MPNDLDGFSVRSINSIFSNCFKNLQEVLAIVCGCPAFNLLLYLGEFSFYELELKKQTNYCQFLVFLPYCRLIECMRSRLSQ